MLVIKVKVLNLYTAWDNDNWLYCVVGIKKAISQGKEYAKKHSIKEIKLFDINNKITIIKI